jgi:hypothetical protein
MICDAGDDQITIDGQIISWTIDPPEGLNLRQIHQILHLKTLFDLATKTLFEYHQTLKN